MDEPVTFDHLLSQGWMARRIVDMLDAKDATRFASVNRRCRVVRLQPPLKGLHDSLSEDGPYHIYHAKVWQTLPQFSNNAHTVMIRCRWKDQGWGNQKGMLSVVAKSGRAPDDYKDWSGFVVAGAEPAPHRLAPLSLSFRPSYHGGMQPYNVWYRVGGGGAHRLSVRDFSVRVLAYEEDEDMGNGDR